jgi:hypothetical protein
MFNSAVKPGFFLVAGHWAFLTTIIISDVLGNRRPEPMEDGRRRKSQGLPGCRTRNDLPDLFSQADWL